MSHHTLTAKELEKLCIAFAWAYGTALEKQTKGKVNREGLTPQTLWKKATTAEKKFVRDVMRATYKAWKEAK